MTLVRVLGIVLVGLLVTSCGEETPPEKCNALVSKTCQRAIACVMDGTTQNECVTEAMTAINCAEADGVAAGYGTCMADLQKVSCAELIVGASLNLPASCEGVILFRI